MFFSVPARPPDLPATGGRSPIGDLPPCTGL